MRSHLPVGVAQLWIVRPRDVFDFELVAVAGEDLSELVQMRKNSEVSWHLARAGFEQRAVAELFGGRHFWFAELI